MGWQGVKRQTTRLHWRSDHKVVNRTIFVFNGIPDVLLCIYMYLQMAMGTYEQTRATGLDFKRKTYFRLGKYALYMHESTIDEYQYI